MKYTSLKHQQGAALGDGRTFSLVQSTYTAVVSSDATN